MHVTVQNWTRNHGTSAVLTFQMKATRWKREIATGFRWVAIRTTPITLTNAFLKPSSKNNEISAKCANASFNLKHPSINILFFSYLDTNTNTNLVILTSLLSLLELVLQVSKFLADLVQHLVKSPVLGIVLVKLRLVSYTLLCWHNWGVVPEIKIT